MAKKKFKETKVGKILGGVLRVGGRALSGAAGGTLKPIIGAAIGIKEGMMEELDANIKSDNGGQGKIDWVRMVSLFATLGLIALVVMGKIDMETFESLLDALDE